MQHGHPNRLSFYCVQHHPAQRNQRTKTSTGILQSSKKPKGRTFSAVVTLKANKFDEDALHFFLSIEKGTKTSDVIIQLKKVPEGDYLQYLSIAVKSVLSKETQCITRGTKVFELEKFIDVGLEWGIYQGFVVSFRETEKVRKSTILQQNKMRRILFCCKMVLIRTFSAPFA